MAEEHRCQAPEGHLLCANNCGFFGSPATMNMCSKCYIDFSRKEQQQASIKSSLSASSPSFSPLPPQAAAESLTVLLNQQPEEDNRSGDLIRSSEPKVATTIEAVPQPNRCSMCRKRVGLTGFRCRCGTTFCGAHRYPEKHGCSFDYKTAGREEIARANPVVIGEKLQKI